MALYPDTVVDSDVLTVPGRRLRRLPSGYRPSGRLAVVVRLGCLAGTVLAGASLAALLTLHDAVGREIGVTAARNRLAGLTEAIVIVGAVTGIAWVAWLRRVYRNIRPLGARWLRLGPGWAVGAWFVPGVNLVAPKLMLDDVWRTSDMAAPHPIGIVWRVAEVPWWLHIWWGMVTVTGLGWLWAALADHDFAEPGPVIALAVVSGAALVALPLSALVVRMISHRQEARARYLELEQPEPRHRPWYDRVLVGGATAVAVAVAVVGLVTWPVPSAEAKSPGAGSEHQVFGVTVAVPFRFSVDVASEASAGSGTISAGNRDGTERLTIAWSPAVPPGDEALFAVLDAAVLSVGGDGETFHRGRPVALMVDDRPALLENFSYGSGTTLDYGAVLVAGCSASNRTITMLLEVETTRPVRNAITQAVVPSLHC